VTPERGGLWQTGVVVGLLLVLGVAGYLWRTSTLQDDAPTATTAVTDSGGSAPPPGASTPPSRSPLGDLSAFRTITRGALQAVAAGDQTAATGRARDLEIAWDDAEARLKPRNKAAWTAVDGKIDKVLREIRATTPDPAGETSALNDLRGALT